MTIADALRGAFEESGWTVTELAYVARSSEGAARKWMTGRAIPRGDKLELLRTALPGFAKRLDTGRRVHGARTRHD